MDMQYKYMAVFFYGVSLYTGDTVAIGEESFQQLLLGFIANYYTKYYETMNKVFNIKYSKEKGYSYRIDYNKIMKYGLLLWNNPKKFSEMYDEVGDDNIKEITDLSIAFCQYVEIIDDINNCVRIRH